MQWGRRPGHRTLGPAGRSSEVPVSRQEKGCICSVMEFAQDRSFLQGK